MAGHPAGGRRGAAPRRDPRGGRRAGRRGILQSVVSKNDHDPPGSGWRSSASPSTSCSPQIGWGRKSDAVGEIAEELGFAHDTIAFIDDQPAERAEVDLPPAATCAATRPRRPRPCWACRSSAPSAVTVDARRRRQMYQAASGGRPSGPSSPGRTRSSCDARTGDADPPGRPSEELARVEELTLRTSQMNATGVHYSDADAARPAGRPARTRCWSPRDRPVRPARRGRRAAAGEARPGCGTCKLLATSCRVVSFGAGAAILNWLVDQAARAGVHLVADFRRDRPQPDDGDRLPVRRLRRRALRVPWRRRRRRGRRPATAPGAARRARPPRCG